MLLPTFILLMAAAAQAQSPTAPAFDVATVKPVDPQPKDGRFFTMQGTNRFVAKNFTVKLLVAAAYDLNPKAITGGPGWLDTAKFDITAVTPGTTRPTRDQQMAMLRTLLADRFRLLFHREQREMPIYTVAVAKAGAKLKSSGKLPTDPSSVISTVYPDHILMPGRNVSMADFVAVLQRAILDRPVVDKSGLTGRYDFDLEWTPSEREFGGDIETPVGETTKPSLSVALQEELGLKLETSRGDTSALVVDRAEKPSTD